jgi:hypothetical protein
MRSDRKKVIQRRFAVGNDHQLVDDVAAGKGAGRELNVVTNRPTGASPPFNNRRASMTGTGDRRIMLSPRTKHGMRESGSIGSGRMISGTRSAGTAHILADTRQSSQTLRSLFAAPTIIRRNPALSRYPIHTPRHRFPGVPILYSTVNCS